MTGEEHEIMVIAAEECAEVIQAISKCIRFGFDDEYAGACTNVSRLAEEVGDLLCMVDLMVERGIIKQSAVYEASIAKRARLEDYSNIFNELCTNIPN